MAKEMLRHCNGRYVKPLTEQLLGLRELFISHRAK